MGGACGPFVGANAPPVLSLPRFGRMCNEVAQKVNAGRDTDLARRGDSNRTGRSNGHLHRFLPTSPAVADRPPRVRRIETQRDRLPEPWAISRRKTGADATFRLPALQCSRWRSKGRLWLTLPSFAMSAIAFMDTVESGPNTHEVPPFGCRAGATQRCRYKAATCSGVSEAAYMRSSSISPAKLGSPANCDRPNQSLPVVPRSAGLTLRAAFVAFAVPLR